VYFKSNGTGLAEKYQLGGIFQIFFQETIAKLTNTYETVIQNLKEEIAFLRKLVKKE